MKTQAEVESATRMIAAARREVNSLSSSIEAARTARNFDLMEKLCSRKKVAVLRLQLELAR
jgi:hypothetical protein